MNCKIRASPLSIELVLLLLPRISNYNRKNTFYTKQAFYYKKIFNVNHMDLKTDRFGYFLLMVA